MPEVPDPSGEGLLISIKELNPHNHATNEVIDRNLLVLFDRLIELQDACELALVITSGLRSDEQQAKLREDGKTKAIASQHLAGAAADILDSEGLLADWCLSNLKALEAIGFWMEHPDYTKGWVHVQINPPRSGRRVFIP
jgi:hypothetical protein